MSTFKPLLGNRSRLDSKEKTNGNLYFCKDDFTLHIDYIDDNGELKRSAVISDNVKDVLSEAKLYTDEKVAKISNAVLYTKQTLTEEQKAQVRANLGLDDYDGDNNTETLPSESVTTNYTYSWDGNNASTEHTWITNYSGVKVFIKLGEVPEGTLNLVGATIFRSNPNNQWLDRTFTITQEHLDKVLNKANTDIPATQEGLIQIYDMTASDFSEFTVLCICTKAGWYDVTFDDWYEIINFPETGIYAYDKRTYGGNDYAKTFTFSVTVEASNENTSGGSSTGGITTSSIPTKYKGNEISMFSRGICIGDSVTEGSFDSDNGGFIAKRFSYPSILKRITGVDIVNAGIAGMTSKTWYEASLNSDDQFGKWVNDEWVWNMNPQANGSDIISTTLDYSNFDFAIIHLGINDIGLMGDATIDETLVVFEENINNIISKLKTSNNGIKIFLSTIIPSYAPQENVTYRVMNEKIRNISDTASDVYLIDLNQYSEVASNTAYNKVHPTAIGYHKIATEIASYISYIVHKNLNDFNDVQFIGTDYIL